MNVYDIDGLDADAAYIFVNLKDLQDFGKTIAIWSIIGGVSLGLLGWGIHATEEDRKLRRQYKREDKARKEAKRVMEKLRKKAAKSSS